MSTRGPARQRLSEPPTIVGDCPSCEGTYPVVTALTSTGVAVQLPEHPRADRWDNHRCPCSGWLARNPRPRTYFYVEGVQFL